MTREMLCKQVDTVMRAFAFEGEIREYRPFGNGHINDTYVVIMQSGRRYIVQRINHEVFKKPWELMENVAGVTAFLRKKIIARGGDPERETMNIVKTHDGGNYFKDAIGCYWCADLFIEGAETFELVRDPEDFYQSGLGFGRFSGMLADYPVETLHDVIPNFHNTPVRFQNFKDAVARDPLGRAQHVREEIAFVLAHESDCYVLDDLKRSGKLPLRVTHNDTKLDNIMIDSKTHTALCVIDLDTVMPGLLVHDFGESIRFGAATSVEDEPDLSKMNLDLGLYEVFTRGFLEGCAGSLTECELDMLPMGAKTMTLENGMRFLADYIEGDIYYRIHSPEQNLNRARAQYKLIRDMERDWKQMHEIIEKYR